MAARTPRVCVFAPAVVLTVMVEEGAGDHPEIHLHAGGQGFWVARLVAELGLPAVLVGPFGGEIGEILRPIVAAAGLELRASSTSGSNGAYVHDRRSGERIVLADMPPARLSRHEVDELYGTMLVEGLAADVCVLTGPGVHPVLPAEVFERLAHDLRTKGVTTVADLSGEFRDRALRGHVSVLKVALDELHRDGWIGSDEDGDVLAVMRRLAASGADAVVATQAERGALALVGDELLHVAPPALQPVETRGAGDSLTAGLAAGLARGAHLQDALRLGAAAGALNVTRRGLGSGAREDIERFTSQITIRSRPAGRS